MQQHNMQEKELQDLVMKCAYKLIIFIFFQVKNKLYQHEKYAFLLKRGAVANMYRRSNHRIEGPFAVTYQSTLNPDSIEGIIQNSCSKNIF
jgi:hypothetical protein